ncbi:hypothetical protein JR316_0001023 [Psilocybe cubensis]|uniref:Uncharacterized protein n=2 Tax=Psilocybe cubensis TaxID=181762 RepID=A0ACB8HH10_PSICU|nr:hypothetical protein JR316_0001023 [Psilocybe cubensis]KAH9486957.1 hypothetical protein JR316_0001023 [Psilocybe cubensis]
MILENTAADDKSKLSKKYSDNVPNEGQSNASTSSYLNGANERDHLLVDLNPQGPPPDFSPYQAEHFEVGYDDVVSHDPHLNSDGEALYRFLLAQSSSCPIYRLHCKGTHTESRTRWVSQRDSHGRTRNVQETYNDTITDFNFCIDIIPGDVDASLSTHDGMPGRTRIVKPVQWTVPDDEPAYRGKMVREYEVEPYSVTAAASSAEEWNESGRRKARRKETKAYDKWVEMRTAHGFPPWVREHDVSSGLLRDPASASISEKDTLKSSKTLRQWADEYCASPKYLKEFVYSKEAYGWNMEQLERAVRATIQSTPYNGTLTVELTPHNTKIYVRPDNKLSRMLSNKWLKFLSIILLIFPFVWLYKRFHPRGGGRWEVCGGAYALKQWVPVESEQDAVAAAAEFSTTPGNSRSTTLDDLPSYEDAADVSVTGSAMPPRNPSSSSSSSSRRFMQTPTGPKKLVGIKEGEWYKSWEGAITRAVIGRYQSDIPLPRNAWSTIQARSLDGYTDAPHVPLVNF